MFHLISAGLFSVLFLYFLYVLYTDYKAMAPEEKANWKDKIWALGYGSATKVWLRMVAVVGACIGQLSNLAYVLNMPELQEAIKAWLKPEYVSVFILIVAFIGVWARNRSLPDDDPREKRVI